MSDSVSARSLAFVAVLGGLLGSLFDKGWHVFAMSALAGIAAIALAVLAKK
jgi:hypothetical protein